MIEPPPSGLRVVGVVRGAELPGVVASVFVPLPLLEHADTVRARHAVAMPTRR
jgi:hypothetical protein